MPLISLTIAAATTEVRVSVTNYELAEEQVKVEEKQRVLGVIPNFYVSYQQDALPLRPKQKFELAWKTSVDPVTFAAERGICRGAAGTERVQRIRARRPRICKALRRRLRGCVDRNHDRGRHLAVAAQAGSTLFLQRNRQHAVAHSLCAGKCGHL